jgi:ribosomal 30S subunit maturation factor RimM
VSTGQLMRLEPSHSSTCDLLMGCSVVTPKGNLLGKVQTVLVNKKTHQMKFVSLGKTVLPWSAMYFDSVNSRLVFYTLVEQS